MKTNIKEEIAVKDEKSEGEQHADISLSAPYMSAILTDVFTNEMFPIAKIELVGKALSDKVSKIQTGDTSEIEAMLIGQAQALQTMFVSIGRKASKQTQMAHYTAFMNLALKAQSQSRATIQALTELKYPKQATFVKQANIANGHQQVNNSRASDTADTVKKSSRTKKIQYQQNELLEVNDGSTKMDSRTAQTTIP